MTFYICLNILWRFARTLLKLWLLRSASLLCFCLKLLHFMTSLWQPSIVISIPGWNLRQIRIPSEWLYKKNKQTKNRCPSLTQWDAGPICVSRGKKYSHSSQSFDVSSMFSPLRVSSWRVQNSLSGIRTVCLSRWMNVRVCFWSEQPPQHYTLSAPGFSSKDLKEAQLRQELQPLTVRRLHLTENSLGT